MSSTKKLSMVVGACLALATTAVVALYKVCKPIVDATAVVLDTISRSL